MRRIKLPALCNLCGTRVKSARFQGDDWGAMKSDDPCPSCGNESLYRADDEDYDNESAISRSAWDRGD